jgi:hypothetical protein
MYDFRTLSPIDFEELVRDLLQAELHLRMESFGPGPDLGIDFRFSEADGKAIVQAKHFLDSGAEALIRVARQENQKVLKLAPARYLLATSVSLTHSLKARLQKAMPDAPLSEDDIFGRADLNNLLGLHPEIERKHFKLWLASTPVLERILHSGVYNRTQTEMDIIRGMVPKFVHNNSIPAAEAILAKSGALIIAGEPGVGKTTLARMLVWLHVEQDWRISVIDEIKEAFEIATDGEKRLVFFDDFLGQVRLSTDLVRGVDQRFPPFLHKVRTQKNLRFILTIRDYILRQAQAYSGRLASTEVNASEFTLDVGFYTRAVRAKLLYNHLYFSEITEIERDSLLEDNFFLNIIDHRNFNPRLIDLLTSADYLSIANVPIRAAVEAVLENPQELWEKPYRTQISDEGRALMVALFFNEPHTGIPVLERTFARMVDAMGFAIARADRPVKFRSALKELEGSVLAIQGRQVRFSNPGVRDFLQRAIEEDRFLPAAINAVAEYAEVKQCWTVFCAQNPGLAESHPTTEGWSGAAGRLLSNNSGTPLQRLHLIVDMYDVLRGEALLAHIRSAVGYLETGDVEFLDVYRCREVIEQLVSSLLPSSELNEAKRVVSAVVAKMLVDYGGALSLDDIERVADTLYEYGSDQEAASDAARESLRAFISDIDSTLSEISSVDELDGFEHDLKRLMGEYDVVEAALIATSGPAGKVCSNARKMTLRGMGEAPRHHSRSFPTIRSGRCFKVSAATEVWAEVEIRYEWPLRVDLTR